MAKTKVTAPEPELVAMLWKKFTHGELLSMLDHIELFDELLRVGAEIVDRLVLISISVEAAQGRAEEIIHELYGKDNRSLQWETDKKKGALRLNSK